MDIRVVTTAMTNSAPTQVIFVSAQALAVLSCMLFASCARQEVPPPAAGDTPPAIAYEAHIAAGGRPPVGGVLTNPLRRDPAAVKNGAALFSAMNCDGCHGGDGSGWVGPNLADGRWRYGGADEEVYSSIYFGRPKGMPAFGGTLGSTAIWSLVTYLQSLPPPADVPTESFEE